LALLHKCNSSRKRRDDTTIVDYSHGNLSSVPEDILLYENTLEELHLEANSLQELPKVKKKLIKNENNFILILVAFSMSSFTSIDFI